MSTFTRIEHTLQAVYGQPTSVMQMLIARDPSRFSATPEPLRHLCPHCQDPQEPRYQYGGYVYRECHCELLARLDAQHRAEVQARHQAESSQYRTAAYSWLDSYNPAVMEQYRLGRHSGGTRLEEHRFESYDRSRFPGAYASAKALAGHVLGESTYLRNLALLGNPGTGKTHLAAAVVNTVTARCIAARFCTAASLFAMLYAVSFEAQQQILYQLGTCPLLVIDDLSQLHIKKDGGEYQQKTLVELLDKRNTRRLPTIITANEMGDLSPWLTSPAVSRMREQGKLEMMIGQDYRLIAKGCT